MAEFKPMVKMFTDEPSVILKLKKGGKVKAAGQSEGFKSMSQTSGGNPFAEAEKGKAPKKPSMADRRKAMNPNMYAKGGKVVHKQMGGAMPGGLGAGALGGMAPAGSGAAMTPMSRSAVAGMAPTARARRAAAVRRALTGMKKGGSTSAECAKLEKELKHHEAMSASKAHGKASGGEIDSAETKTTLKTSVKPFAKTKMDTAKKDKAHGTGEVKEGKPGGYAMGGSIMGNEGPFENTKMVTAGKGKTGGTTGGVRMGNAGGFKHGGQPKKMARGGMFGVTPGSRYAMSEIDPQFRANFSGPYEGPPEPEYPGGYKKGGKAMMKKASGGAIDSKMTRTTVEGGNWENRPANTSKPGKTNTKTGEVKEANAGGYKRGGSASKKAFATGGNVVDDGKAVKMPRHFVSQPVANSLQSGTFKKGGKVMKAEGGNIPAEAQSAIKQADAERAFRDYEKSETQSNKAMRDAILGAPRRAFEAVKGMLSSEKAPPAGSVTKTEKSVTVSPGKKRGGLAKC